jgi:hypothetical protein
VFLSCCDLDQIKIALGQFGSSADGVDLGELPALFTAATSRYSGDCRQSVSVTDAYTVAYAVHAHAASGLTTVWHRIQRAEEEEGRTADDSLRRFLVLMLVTSAAHGLTKRP